MHPSCIWASFARLILPSRAAGQHHIPPHLPYPGIDFQSRLNYFAVRLMTQVLHPTLFDRASPSIFLTPNFTKKYFHTWVVFISFLFCFSFPSFSPSFIVWQSIHNICVCVRDGSEVKGGRVHMMNNAWCGFLVRQTVGTLNRPWGPFTPHHHHHKLWLNKPWMQKTVPYPLLLLYGQDLSSSIHDLVELCPYQKYLMSSKEIILSCRIWESVASTRSVQSGKNQDNLRK